VEIPKELPRFLKLGSHNGVHNIMMMDDVIRIHLLHVFRSFKPEIATAYTFKFSRDAEIDLEEDEDLSYIDRMTKGIKKRKFGAPVRMVYDSRMPEDLVEFLRLKLGLKEHENIIPGGKYHNFKDFMGFPSFGNPEHHYLPQPPIDHPTLFEAPSLFKACMKSDTMLHFPYQKFTHIIELLREAALDPKVKCIYLNIYRAAKDSKVLNALITALRNGKRVVVVFELLARFDEENNIYWSHRLKENGAEIKYGLKGYKVHSKLMMIQRVSRGVQQELVYIGTGNFNEKTALIYEDFAFLTANKIVVEEVKQIFDFMVDKKPMSDFQELIVSPFNSRERWEKLIDEEIAKGKNGRIFLKMNSLNDAKMIEKLYDASNAGVVVQVVCRGMCCLAPGIPNQSENIEVHSIVGRYLEHSRVFCFGSDIEDLKIFIGSSDWMQRNLDRRIEVVTPVHSLRLKKQLFGVMKTLWSGNKKSRVIDVKHTNKYVPSGMESIDAQATIYHAYKNEAR
jgi:polyphosphate kinase